MKAILLTLTTLVLLAVEAGAVPLDQIGEAPPVQATLLRRYVPKGKLAWRNEVRLTLKNRYEAPVWLLLRPRAETPLEANGNFVKDSSGFPFLLKEHPGKNGAVRELFFFARNGFIAFRLAPGAHVDLDRYPILAWHKLRELEVWEVRNLKLNDGDTPLEEWLPTDTLCKDSNVVPSSAKVKWGPLCAEDACPAGGIHSIRADVIRRWNLPLQ